MRSATLGKMVTASIFEIKNDNPELVALVANKTKVAYEVDPGRRLFMVVSESADYMSADLAPNRTYYALVTPRFGIVRERFSLAPVNKGGNTCKTPRIASRTAGWSRTRRSRKAGRARI